jgi:hypothetical protein
MTDSDEELPEWCRVLRDTAKRQKMTYPQIAARAGLGLGKVQRIMNSSEVSSVDGKKKREVPSADEMIKICRALDLSEVRMLIMLGHLRPVWERQEYNEELEELASGMSLTAGSIDLDQKHGAGFIAAKIVATGKFRVTIAPLMVGKGRFCRHVNDLIAVQPLPGCAADGLKDRLQELVRVEMAWFQAGFIGLPETAASLKLPTPDPATVISVARMNAIRRGSGSPLDDAPRSTCVVGSHWAGSADVASWLAYAFDLDFAHVGFVASRAFARLLHDEHDVNAYERQQVARTYVAGAERLGRPRVWAVGGDNCLHTFDLLNDERLVREPHVVYLRATDQLMRWTAGVRYRVEGHQTKRTMAGDLDAMQEERRKIEEILRRNKRLERRTVVLPVGLPDGPDFGDEREDGRDAFYGMWALLAERALTDLHAVVAAHSPDRRSFDLDDAMSRMRGGGLAAA